MSRAMSRRPRFDECLDSMHRRAICHNMPANVEELTIPCAIRSSSSLSYLFKNLLTAPRPVAVPLAARHASSNCSWPSMETKKDVCLVSILVLLPASQASSLVNFILFRAMVQFVRRMYTTNHAGVANISKPSPQLVVLVFACFLLRAPCVILSLGIHLHGKDGHSIRANCCTL